MTGASGTSLFAGAAGEEEKGWTTATSTKPSVPQETSWREDGSGSSTSSFRQEDLPVSRRNKLLQVTGRQMATTQVMQENTVPSSPRNLSTQLVNDTTIRSPSVSPKVVTSRVYSTFPRRAPSFHPSSQVFRDFYLPRSGKNMLASRMHARVFILFGGYFSHTL